MKLNEIKPERANDREAMIEQFMEEHDIKKWKLNDEGRVDVDTDVNLYGHKQFKDGKLPFPWGHIEGWFQVDVAGLSSYENFPTKVLRTCSLEGNKFTNFEGLDGTQQYRTYKFKDNPIKSLKNIHKHITSAEEVDFRGCPIEDSILGICLIDGLKYLNGRSPDTETHFTIFKHQGDPVKGRDGKLQYVDLETAEIFSAKHAAFLIVEKYLGKGRAGVLDAQKELEELELDDFAKL